MNTQTETTDVRFLISQARDLASVSPIEFAEVLAVDLRELERNAHVEPGTARWFPQSEAIQAHIRASLLIIDALIVAVQDSSKAIFLFKNYPCEEFGYKTPQMLVGEGRVVDVLLRL